MKRIIFISTLAIISIIFFNGCDSEASSADIIRPANIFNSNMVLQREKPITIWGMASPKSTVKVLFKGQEKSVRSKSDSTWSICLEAEDAGGPFDLNIIGKDTISYNNVMVGEVWICSGQSNMQMQMGNAGRVTNYEKEIAEAKYPDIRLRSVGYKVSLLPQSDLFQGSWDVCTPEAIEHFSATAYFFAKKLHKELNVPIGVICAAVGGTPIESWTSSEFIKKAKDVTPLLSYENRTIENVEKEQEAYKLKMNAWFNDFEEVLANIEDQLPNMAAKEFNDNEWETMKLPQPWEEVEGGLGYTDGVVWFRKSFYVNPSNIQNDEFEISLGYIHDKNKTFINGELIGEKETRWGTKLTKYNIPEGLIRKGENTIAIKITNYDWIGGICRDNESLWIKNKGEKIIDLCGDWKYKMIFDFDNFQQPPVSSSDSHQPAALFNGMINPLTSLAIRGCIWYQGEENANRPIQYRHLFPLLIESWRKEWNQDDLPFYFVQLANYMDKKDKPGKSNWAALRDAQNAALSMPNTGQAVIIDIGEAENIHPKNKQDVGLRLALNALNSTYNQDIEYSGPVYESMQIKADTIEISFTHSASGLVLKNPDDLKSFAIAGKDKKFVWAETKIDGEDILVWSNEISEPVAVRYGWANNPDCNLYNSENLPASPFRTDNWDIELELEFQTFPKIDAHIHLYTEDDSYINLCNKNLLQLLTLATNSADLPPIEDQIDNANMLKSKHPETVSYATCFGMEEFLEPGWNKKVITKLQKDFDDGAIAVKVWKDIGMTHKDRDGSFIFMDDEIFDSIWSFIESQDKPLVNHVGEPKNCWLPLSEMTVINDKWYYSEFPEFHMFLHPDDPSHEELMKSRDHVLDKHPNLQYIGCHLASLEYSVEKQAEFLEKYPNASMDMAARIPHFKVQDRDKVREFIIKYQDRLLYGTDIVLYDGTGNETTFLQFRDLINKVYLNDWEYFTTDNIFNQEYAPKEYQGLDLPNKVLEKIYYKNAIRMYPGILN